MHLTDLDDLDIFIRLIKQRALFQKDQRAGMAGLSPLIDQLRDDSLRAAGAETSCHNDDLLHDPAPAR